MCTPCNQENFQFCNTLDSIQEQYTNHFISEDLKIFFKEINDFNKTSATGFSDNEDEPDITPLLNCNYVDITSLNKHKVNNKTVSIIHLNISSLAKNKEEFEAYLSLLNIKFDIIGITETKIKYDSKPNYELDINGYTHYSMPSEANKGGTMIYVHEKHQSIPRKDLEKIMYKSHHLESTFLEIIVPNNKNILVGCIYRHPSMELKSFNEDHFKILLNKLNDKKHTFLLGDFNVDLMKTDNDSNTTNYFDMLTSAQFVPHIIHPTRITNHTKTLIDNIFSNLPNFSQGISGNLTLSSSDYLAQFLLLPFFPVCQRHHLGCRL